MSMVLFTRAAVLTTDAELNYTFNHFKCLRNKGWEATTAVAFDQGEQIGDNLGITFSIKKTGLLLK